MISVVVCSRYKQGLGTHQSHVMEASGVECSYIPVDNSENRFSITEAYNIGIEKAQGDIIVFMHEDVYFATPGWGRVLEDKFRNLDNPGIIGVAGSQCLLRDNPFWGACGRPFVKGKVIHQNWENDLFLTVFSEESGDFRVAGVDGLFFAVSAPALRGVRFDEENFDRFHFYDLDLCMQVNFGYSIYVTDDILVKHFSKGAFDDTWREYGARFLRKYRDRLPFSVSEIEYRPEKREQFSGVDMITQVSAPVYSYLRSLGSECRDEKKTVTNRGFTVIAGMHRSGTSCIAGLLNKCGVAAGNQEEMLNSNSAREDNKKGHFENRYAVRINDALLNIAGGNWAALPRQESIDKAGDLKGDYIKDFSGRFDGELVKDPRISLTINTWKRFLDRVSKLIIALRHPLGVAESLWKRNRMQYERSLSLWFEYNTRLIRNCSDIPFIVVDYDRLETGFEQTLSEMLRFIGFDPGTENIKGLTGDFFDKGMNHASGIDMQESVLPPRIKELYDVLKAQSVQEKLL